LPGASRWFLGLEAQSNAGSRRFQTSSLKARMFVSLTGIVVPKRTPPERAASWTRATIPMSSCSVRANASVSS